ncbi:histidine triad (HIT) family protein [Poseidonocella pacifica]|uniref:Histidine triad (HIT) family protein n=1 Tax=Poseidonocella pacifica TaxID=871651 RepID=A0A1I0Y6K4_9RHOB|nr:HIT domain-containing protein [Poseidonocella pacifica]SFB08457.1 histidine triad (HIT) family protein [Poseidonocella pacifica]
MAYAYDDENIFAKILRGEIPNKTVLETEHCLAFEDIAPKAPVHVLVIPKGPYVCYDHFADEASDEEIVDFVRTIGEISRMTGVVEDGFRVISNAKHNGAQEVPHLHVHVLGGKHMGPMVTV